MAKNDVRSGKIDLTGIVASGELEVTAEIDGGLSENQIVVYQPNETVRLEVRLENETVWLTQSQMGTLFGCTTRNVRLHLENIYSCGELVQEATRKDFFLVRLEGNRSVHRTVTCYNLDAIISVGYRVNSILGVKFRQWATKILKEYLLKGYSVNARLNQLEDTLHRNLATHDQRIATLEEKVDFFVQTQTPPLQGVFYNGQLWDARVFVERLIGSAKRSLLLIDNWATVETLEIYLIGASLKDLGKKCFAFTKLDPGTIRGIKKSAFTRAIFRYRILLSKYT